MNAHIDLASRLGGAALPASAGRRDWLATLCQQQVRFDALAEQLGCDPTLPCRAARAAGRQHAHQRPASCTAGF